MRQWVAFAGSVVALEIFFVIAGLPLALLWKRESTAVRLAASPVLGIGFLALFSWYWSRAGISGLAPLARPLMILLPLASIGVVLLLRRRGTGPAIDLRQASFVAFAWVAALLLVGFIAAPVIGIGYRTSAVLTNNDIAAYALLGQHLADHDMGNTGPIAGYDLSSMARNDVFGAGAVLSLGAGLLGTDVWKITVPALAAAWVNVVGLLVVLAWQRFRLRAFPALATALLAVGSSFFTMIAFSYFFAQILGFAFVLLTLLILTQPQIRSRLCGQHARLSALLAVSVAGLILTYPALVLVGLAVVGAALITGAAVHRGGLLRAGRVAAVMICGVAVGAASVPYRSRLVLSLVTEQASGTYGYPMRGLTPLAILGVQRVPGSIEGAAMLGTALLLLLIAAGVGIAAVKDYPLARETAALLPAVVGGWLYFVVRRGSTAYPTWKWLGYFQPLVVCATVALTSHLAVRIWPRGPSRARGREVMLLGLGALLAVTVLNGRSTMRGFETRSGDGTVMAGQGWLLVNQTLADLGNNTALKGLTEININLTPFWEEMWAAYFLRDIPRINLMSASYYAKVPPDPTAWTLQRVELTPDTPGVKRVQVNERYVLVDKPSPPVG